MKQNQIRIADSIYGFVVGDALGVPVEFLPRELLKKHQVTDMMENKKRKTTIGYWSDDTAMVLCSMQSILDKKEVVYDDLLEKFLMWFKTGYMGVNHKCFGIGQTTYKSISKYKRLGYPACIQEPYPSKRNSGNGSLMRMLPIIFFLYYHSNQQLSDKYRIIEEVSRLTHGSSECLQACVFYGMFIFNLLDDMEMHGALSVSIVQHTSYYGQYQSTELERILSQEILVVDESQIQSTGYVVSTLEASLWCLFTSASYSEATLKAVNLGYDTDTVAAITGSMAGLIYGLDQQGEQWKSQLQESILLDSVITSFLLLLLNQ